MNRKQITTRILPGLLLIIACVWLLCRISFPQNIFQQIRAEVYADGACIGTETITIDGSKTGGLFTGKQEFYGRMHIPSAAQTASETLKMQIFWDKELGYQRIICIPQPGTVTNAEAIGLVPCMLTNRDMTQFALMLTDGTVIATSAELHALYRRHIAWDASANRLSVTGPIPPID